MSDTPFSYQTYGDLGGILGDSCGSIMLTTYNSHGGLVSLGSKDGELKVSSLSIPKCSGIDTYDGRLALGMKTGIIQYQHFDEGIAHIDGHQEEGYDACFIPRKTTFTGYVNIHDVFHVNTPVGVEPWFVNSQYSSICRLSPDYSFQDLWKPPFIDQVLPIDQCHINCVASDNRVPAYVSALGKTTDGNWRPNRKSSGIIIDCQTNEIYAEGLCLPHSLTLHNGVVWLCNSGKGEVGYIDPTSRAFVPVVQIDGFTRGLAISDGKLFVGVSALRPADDFPETFKANSRENRGVHVFDIESQERLAGLTFTGVVEDLYDVHWTPYMNPYVATTFETCTEAVQSVPDHILQGMEQVGDTPGWAKDGGMRLEKTGNCLQYVPENA